MIVVRAYLLIGFPGETWESIEVMRCWLDRAPRRRQPAHDSALSGITSVGARVSALRCGFQKTRSLRCGELNDDDPKTLVLDLPTMTKAELFQARGELHEWIVNNISLRLANR